MVDGPTPLMHFDKPLPGTGASVLLQIIYYTIMGRTLTSKNFPTTEEELNKVMLPEILSGKPMIPFDNLTPGAKFDHPFFAGIITSGYFEGRILGKSEIGEGPVRGVFYTTGNNIDATPEMLRRTHSVYLNAQTDRPENRKAKHERLIPWLRKNRAHLAWAVHILGQNWIAQGCPRYEEKKLGSFEEWSGVMGGILAASGMFDMSQWLLVNDRYYDIKAQDEFDALSVIEWWMEEFADQDMTCNAREFRKHMFPAPETASPTEVLNSQPSVPGVVFDSDARTLDAKAKAFLNKLALGTYNLKDGKNAATLVRDSNKFQLKIYPRAT
jgi:hypothetical protein